MRYPRLGHISLSWGCLTSLYSSTLCLPPPSDSPRARPKLECHILLLGRGPTPLLWRACRTPLPSDMRTMARQTLLCPQGCASGSPWSWGSSQSACSLIYSPPPAPVAAHHGAQEDNSPPSTTLYPPCPDAPVGFRSGISAVSWPLTVRHLGTAFKGTRKPVVFCPGVWGAFLLPCWLWTVTQGTRGQLCPPLPSRSNKEYIFNGPCTYIYVCMCIYIYMCVWPWPQWGAVQLFEGGDTERQF